MYRPTDQTVHHHIPDERNLKIRGLGPSHGMKQGQWVHFYRDTNRVTSPQDRWRSAPSPRASTSVNTFITPIKLCSPRLRTAHGSSTTFSAAYDSGRYVRNWEHAFCSSFNNQADSTFSDATKGKAHKDSYQDGRENEERIRILCKLYCATYPHINNCKI